MKLYNGILIGATGWAMYKISPEANPYAFTACTMGFCHGVLRLIDDLTHKHAKVEAISCSIVQIGPLPLVNIELYLMSGQSNALALAHGFFIIPMCFDVLFKLLYNADDRAENHTEALKDLTILGNVVSLLFLSVNERSYLYGSMALSAFMSQYGAMASESLNEGSMCNVTSFCNMIFFLQTLSALTTTGHAR